MGIIPFSPRPPGLSQRPGQAVQVVLPGPSGPLAMGGRVTSQRSRPNLLAYKGRKAVGKKQPTKKFKDGWNKVA